MSRMSELDFCIGELRIAAQSLIAVADNLSTLFGGDAEPDAAPTEPPKASPQAESPAPKPITLEQVRAVLAEKSRNGHTAQVRALLEKHGAAKLSEIDPAEYAGLLAEAEVLGDGVNTRYSRLPQATAGSTAHRPPGSASGTKTGVPTMLLRVRTHTRLASTNYVAPSARTYPMSPT